MRQNSTVIYLRRDLSLLPTSGRPMSQANPVEKLYRQRAPLYEQLADLTVDNQGTPEGDGTGDHQEAGTMKLLALNGPNLNFLGDPGTGHLWETDLRRLGGPSSAPPPRSAG